METCVKVASVTVSAILPGGEVVVDLLKEVWDLYQQIKQINGSSAMCEALYARLELLAKRLDSDRAKLEDSNAIAAVIDKYRDTVNNFKNCLDGWIKYAEEHRIKKHWKFKEISGKIQGYDNDLNDLHQMLDHVHIIEMEKWKQTDSEWKEKLKHEFARFGNQVANEHGKTKEHVTEEHGKTKEHVTEDGNKTRNFMAFRFESFREKIQLKKKDIWELTHNFKNASDEEKDKLSHELWDQCIHAVNEKKERNAIPGLVALVKYSIGKERLAAANKLSELARTQAHLNDIVSKDGINALMNLASEGEQIEQIEATLGVIYRFAMVKENQVNVKTVKPLLLALRDSKIPEAKKMAAIVLYYLSNNQDGKEEIARCNGISALVDTLRGDNSTPDNRQQKAAALATLKNLFNDPVYHPEFAKIIPELMKAVKDSSEKVSVLDILVELSKKYRAEIVAADGSPSFLVTLLPCDLDTYGTFDAVHKSEMHTIQTLKLLMIIYDDLRGKIALILRKPYFI